MDILRNENGTLPNHQKSHGFENTLESHTNVTSVASFYDDAVILVTGGTGFVGKVLLEKLLRSCSGIKKIYVLLRPKRNSTVENRYNELLRNQVFDLIRTNWPERLKKLLPVSGDVSAPGCGIVDSLKDVNIIFHSAATVHFVEPFHRAVKINVGGAIEILQLAKTMPRLKALVHLSTAYSNANRFYIEEVVYPPPLDPKVIMKCVETLPSEIVNFIGDKIQGKYPNIYTLTKALAESIIVEHKDLPVCIVRPSIVTPALQEPFPGWIDNLNGITGLMMMTLRGVFRTLNSRGNCTVDMMPVDLVVNNCILAAWRTGIGKANHCPIYNVTSGSVNPLHWEELCRLSIKWARLNPTSHLIWYPNITCIESSFVNAVWETVCQVVPACIYDMILRAHGKKVIMLRLARRMKLTALIGAHFSNNEWRFGIKELTALHNLAGSAEDNHTFAHRPDHFLWDSYIRVYMQGIRKFILKDSDESLPYARAKLRRLYWLHNLIRTCLGLAGITLILIGKFRLAHYFRNDHQKKNIVWPIFM